MKFVAVIDYVQDAEKRQATHAQHRVYLRGLLDDGRLAAAGVLADGAGAVWVYDADTLDGARALIEDDPFHAAGVSTTYDLRPLEYWSAKAAVGQA